MVEGSLLSLSDLDGFSYGQAAVAAGAWASAWAGGRYEGVHIVGLESELQMSQWSMLTSV